MKIYKQESDISCGVACLRSIFVYYGKELSEKEILDKTEFFKMTNGVMNPIVSSGITALNFGFKAQYIGFNPIICNGMKLDLLESLKKRLASGNYFDYGKFQLERTLEFLNLGGEYKIERLDADKIKKLIDEHDFIMADVKPAFIKNASLGFFHKIIVDGYNEDSFHVLDPSGEEYFVPFTNFLMGFYAAMPEVLIIKPNVVVKDD